MPRPKLQSGLPSKKHVLDFITSSDTPAGKREIARAFGLHGQDKIALKALLKDMADEGLIDSAPGRAFHKMGGLPKVTVLRVVDVDDETGRRAVGAQAVLHRRAQVEHEAGVVGRAPGTQRGDAGGVGGQRRQGKQQRRRQEQLPQESRQGENRHINLAAP